MKAPRVATTVAIASANSAEVQAWNLAITGEEGEDISRILHNLFDLGHVAGFSIGSVEGSSFGGLLADLGARFGDLTVGACREAGVPSVQFRPAFLIPAWFIQAQAQEALDALPVALLRDKLQQAAAANAEQLGVFCLAETIESVLMWSHYATNHHGIALRFDFARGHAENLLPIWKVDYQLVRPVIADMHVAVQERPLADALAVKADFWRYEQEWRVMKADMARTVVQFDRTIITGIALGAKCTAEHEAAIRGMIGDAEIDLYRMCVDRHTFDLTMRAV